MAVEKLIPQRIVARQFQSRTGAVRRQAWTAPAATSNTAVHAAINQPASGTTVVTTSITNPDFPRNLIAKGNQSTCTGNVVIAGTDIRGNAITETIAASGTSGEAGNKAFATVTSITIPAQGASGDTLSIGIGVKLGLDRNLLDQSVLDGYADGVREATFPTVAASGTVSTASISSNTVSFNTAPNGSHNFSVYFATTEVTEASGTTS
jgi:hypothetical protein